VLACHSFSARGSGFGREFLIEDAFSRLFRRAAVSIARTAICSSRNVRFGIAAAIRLEVMQMMEILGFSAGSTMVRREVRDGGVHLQACFPSGVFGSG